jgi:hypothetical protein
MLTRSNIAYDFNISPHKAVMKYETTELTYVFSSNLYKQKFFDKLKENREKIETSLSNRFNFNIKNELLCDIKLYTDIEKRGFLLIQDGEKITCQDNITLDGNKLIPMNYGKL